MQRPTDNDTYAGRHRQTKRKTKRQNEGRKLKRTPSEISMRSQVTA